MQSRVYVLIFVLQLCLLSGCKDGSSENAVPDNNDYNAIIIENSLSGEDESDILADESDEKEPSGEITEEVTAADMPPEILHFRDVFGEEYEVEIDPYVKKHEYDLSAFIHDGQLLKYEDDKWTSRLGIDVSHHQGNINWQAVKDQGFDFVIIRIGYRGYGTEGQVCPDKKYSEYIKQAKEVGLDVGVYFFAQAVNKEEAAEEARFVLDTLDGETLTLPVVYDPESILDAKARTDDVTGEQFTENTVEFLRLIAEAGYEPMVYSNMLWEAYELDLKELDGIKIWYADYEELPQTPYDFIMWQYSNEGRVNGISGACDLDILLIPKNEE